MVGIGSNFILGRPNLRMAAPLGCPPPIPSQEIKFANLNTLRLFLGQFCKCYSNHLYAVALGRQGFLEGGVASMSDVYVFIYKQACKTRGVLGDAPPRN